MNNKSRTVSDINTLAVLTIIFCTCVSNANPSVANKVGYKDVGEIAVPSGSSLTASDEIIVGNGGELRKTGGGELTVPLSKVNQQVPWSMSVEEGSMRLEAGADATAASAPSVIAEKATVWFDAGVGTVTTNGDADVALVKKWVDVRDKDAPDAPTRVYATPMWGTYASSKIGVPPLKTVKDGRAALYFGGPYSSQAMALSGNISDIRHVFVVHGAYDCFGAVLGSSSSRSGMVVTMSKPGTLLKANFTQHFVTRADLNPSMAAARSYLNGEVLDPYSGGPRVGFQLFSSDFINGGFSFNRIFRSGFEVIASGDTDKSGYAQGGDYVSEIIAFTNCLASGEVENINRYLMRKWNLPASDGTQVARLPAKGTIGIASNATVEVSAGSGETTAFLAFNGAGTVRKTGEGTLDIGPDDGTSSGLTLDLREGTVLSRGGRPIPVSVTSGDHYTASIYNAHGSGSRSAATDIASGAKMTRSANAMANTVVKDGNDWLRVNSVDSSVKKLEVKGGTVQLVAKAHPNTHTAAGTTFATVPNGDFELPFAVSTSHGRGSVGSNPLNGWRATASSSVHYVSRTNSDALVWFSDSASTRPIPPSGHQCLLIVQTSDAETDVTFPQDGDYDLEFYVANRYGSGTGSNSYACFIQVMLGADSSHLANVGGPLLSSGLTFTHFRLRLDGMKAGTSVLRFSGLNNNYDSAALIDDVRITYVGKRIDNEAFKVPNGDFETLTMKSAQPRYETTFGPYNTSDGWTLTVDEGYSQTAQNSYIGVVSPGIGLTSTSTVLLPDMATHPYGNRALLFLMKRSNASTKFTAPAGTFYLKANVARRSMYFTPAGSKEQSADYTYGGVRAFIALENGVTNDLGSISFQSLLSKSYCWPIAFTIPSEQEVTLILYQTEPTGSALVDDIAFVTGPQASFLENAPFNAFGGAESLGGWNTTYDNSYFVYSGTNCRNYDNANIKAYGYAAYEGSKAFEFQCCGTWYQNLRFTEAGTYRFTCHARTRADDAAYSGNAIRIWVSQSGSGVTNIIDTLPMPYSCNFLERSYLFTIPEPGMYAFGMSGQGVEGAGPKADRLTVFDGLSIKAVEEPIDPTVSMPEDIIINIASGSRLVLDYTGTNTIRGVWYGGMRLPAGIIDSNSHPECIGGAGALKVENDGFYILLR